MDEHNKNLPAFYVLSIGLYRTSKKETILFQSSILSSYPMLHHNFVFQYMSFEQERVFFGQTIRIYTQRELDSPESFYIVGKRFDKRYTYMVHQQQIKKLNNSDNSLFQVVRAEKSKNRQQQTRTEVKFGEQICLKHVNSGKFLQIADEFSDAARGSFKVLLTDQQSANTGFQLQPSRTFQKISDPIKFNTHIYIYNPKYEVYLCRELYSEQNVLIGNHMKDLRWRLEFYSNDIECQEDDIMNNDLVYLINSKGSGLLSMYIDEGEEYVVKNVPDSYPIKKEPKLFNCIWLVSFGFENDYPWGREQYKLKDDDVFKIYLTHLVEDRTHANTYAKLVHGSDLGRKPNRIKSGEYIKLGVQQEKKKDIQWLKQEDNKGSQSLVKQFINTKRPRWKPRPPGCKGLIGTYMETESVVFQIIKLPFSLKKQLFESIEAKQKMKQFNNWISCDQEQAFRLQPEQQRARRFKQTQQICRHILKCMEAPNVNIMQRQMMLFDIRFIGMVLSTMKLLYKKQSSNQEAYIPELEKNRGDLARIFSLLHKILRMSCKNNSFIKQDISKNNVKQLLFLSTEGTAGSFADDTQTLKQIFSGNRFAVENVMQPNQVDSLISKFRSSPMTPQRFIRFLQILRLLCKSSDQIIPMNQRIIIKKFLQARGANCGCDIKLRTNKREEVLVSMDEQGRDWLTLIELSDKTRSKSAEDEWRQFIQWIELVSYVCQSKNSVGKYFAQTVFNPRVLLYFLTIPRIKLQTKNYDIEYFNTDVTNLKLFMHKYIIRLIDNVHVNTIYNQKIRFESLCLLNTIQKLRFQSLHQDKVDIHTDIYVKIRQFITQYIDMLCEFTLDSSQYVNDDSGVDQQQSTYVNFFASVTSIMNLLKNMIEHGLWTDQQDIQLRNLKQKELLSKLVTILKLSNVRQSVNYKMPILKIIMFYINQDRYQKVNQVIKSLYSQYQALTSDKEPSYSVSSEIDDSINFLDNETITKIKYTIIEIICSQAGKDTDLFILSLNTNNQLIEVRRALFLSLKSTLVIEPTLEDMLIMKKIRRAREVFGVFKSKGLKTVTLQNQYELDVPIWDCQNESVIGMILELLQYMKTPYEQFKKKRIYDKLGERDQLYQPYTECQQPNKKVQKMIKQMGLHKCMFNIIKDFNPTVYMDAITPHSKLVQAIYYFLAVFAWKNTQNKLQLTEIWAQMKDHAEINCGAICALKEYFSENQSVLYDEDKISIVSEKITDYISERQNDDYHLLYAAKLLDFFSALLTVKGNKLEQNCIRVLSYILDKARLHITKPPFLVEKQSFKKLVADHQDERDNIILKKTMSYNRSAGDTYSKDSKPRAQKTTIREIQSVKEVIDDDVVFRSAQSEDEDGGNGNVSEVISFNGRLTYIITLFDLLADLVSDNDINIAKCKKLHTPDLIIFVLSNSKRCWALKSAARNYINRLYYSRMESQYYDRIADTEMDCFIGDMNDYIRTRLTEVGLQNIRISNPIRFTYPMTNLFFSIKRVVESLLLITDDKQKDNFVNQLCNDMRRGNVQTKDLDSVYATIQRFLRLYERLRFIKLYFFIEQPLIRSQIQIVLQRMECKIFQFNFQTHSFINKNDKSFDYREVSKKLMHGDSNSVNRQQKNEINEELSLCSKLLSNSELENYFSSDTYYKTYACDNDVVLSFLDKNQKDPYSTIIDKKFKKKQSVIRIVNGILNRKKPGKPPKPTFTEYYNNFLYKMFTGGRLRDIQPSNVRLQNQTQKNVIQTVNKRISYQYDIFSSSHLTFYFRTLACIFQSKQDNPEADDELKHYLNRQLNSSFAQMIFKAVVQCDLHQNIQVAYELFYFSVIFYRQNSVSGAQQYLYDLVHNDVKNQFLVKLDNFILFLSNDIIRSCEADILQTSQKQEVQRSLNPQRHGVFNKDKQFFVTVEQEQSSVDHAITNLHTLECFMSVFQLLQLLCENNFVKFKKEFREQKADTIKLNNRNLLIRSTIELRKIFRVYGPRIKCLPQKILDFLNQIAQIPCQANQIELSKSTFFQDVCQFVSQSDYCNPNPQLLKQVMVIAQKFLKIVLSLLESNTEDIYVSFTTKMDRSFFSNLLSIYRKLTEADEDCREFAQGKIKKLKITMLIIDKQLQTWNENKKEKKKEKDDRLLVEIQRLIEENQEDECFKLRNSIESIEVTLDGHNHKLYFFRPEEAADINDDDNECLESISESLNRDTQLQKLQSLMRRRRDLQLYMIYRFSLRNSKFWQAMLNLPINTYATIVSLIINVVLVATTGISIEYDHAVSKYQPMLVLLKLLQFFLGSLYCGSTIYNEVKKAMLQKYNQNATDDDRLQLKFQPLNLWQLYRVLLMQNASILTYYIICILGFFLSPYYYSIHLFYLFSKVKTLENVYLAVVENLYQLIFLSMFGVGFFVAFSVLTISTYAPFAGEEHCNTVFECFLVIYNKEVFIQKNQANQPSLNTLSFEIIYAVFFGSLFGNIVSGLMTDTFAELRDKQNRITQDELNFCYICGQSRYEIEKDDEDGTKLNEKFIRHTKKHNKWSYLYYIYELKKKQCTEYTGLEYIIDEKVKKRSATWFPVKTYEERNIQSYIQALRKIP